MAVRYALVKEYRTGDMYALKVTGTVIEAEATGKLSVASVDNLTADFFTKQKYDRGLGLSPANFVEVASYDTRIGEIQIDRTAIDAHEAYRQGIEEDGGDAAEEIAPPVKSPIQTGTSTTSKA